MCAVKKDTLCWSCKNACGGCSWSRDFTPVEGWNATPTKINSHRLGQIDSYIIHDCPEFEEG